LAFQKNTALLIFTAVNCLDLKTNRRRHHTHLIEMPMVVTSTGSKFYQFTPLACARITWEDFYTRFQPSRDYMHQELCKRTKENEKGQKAILCLVLMTLGLYQVRYPVYLTDGDIDGSDSRTDWQAHKYSFSVKR
jgi:hypothetical protein